MPETPPGRVPLWLSGKRATIRTYGVRNLLSIAATRALGRLTGGPIMGRLTSPFSRYPLRFRCNSSDVAVFRQIFIEREYSCFDDLQSPGLIIDCGANVGYSSAYFLSRFPECSIIAVEPDQGNCEVLRRNLAPFGTRARTIQSAVWSRPTRLKIIEDRYRDGREWTRQVSETDTTGEGTLQAVDVGGLLAGSGFPRIALLKMDIEGAEVNVFSSGYESWLDSVDNIAIELHSDTHFGDAESAFANAISGRGFEVSRSGELTICRRTIASVIRT